MRFLVAILAVVGCASASVISPLVWGVNPGDAQAAAIETRAAIRDNAQAWTDAARLSHDVSRNINENVYWNNVAAAQNQAAVNSAILTGRNAIPATLPVSPLALGVPVGIGSPLGLGAIRGLNLAVPYGLGGLGLRAW